MRAVRYHAYGGPDVVQVEDVPDPVPRPGQVLVRVRAAALNPKDVFLRKGKPGWIRLLGGGLPKGVGFDFAGERADSGERVYGMLDGFRGATCAELLAAPAANLAPMPAGLAFTAAAALPLVTLTALQALRDDGRLRSGGSVLVYGASGGVGTAALQLAKALGAGQVTSASSGANQELCRALGADQALDYAADPLPPPGRRFDVVFDTIGKLSFARWRHALAPGGTLVGTVPDPRLLLAAARTAFASRRARLVGVRARRADLALVARFVEEGRLRPVVDSVYPLAQGADAFRRLETRRARGKIVIDLG